MGFQILEAQIEYDWIILILWRMVVLIEMHPTNIKYSLMRWKKLGRVVTIFQRTQDLKNPMGNSRSSSTTKCQPRGQCHGYMFLPFPGCGGCGYTWCTIVAKMQRPKPVISAELCRRCPVAPTGSNGFWSFMIFIHTRRGALSLERHQPVIRDTGPMGVVTSTNEDGTQWTPIRCWFTFEHLQIFP